MFEITGQSRSRYYQDQNWNPRTYISDFNSEKINNLNKNKSTRNTIEMQKYAALLAMVGFEFARA